MKNNKAGNKSKAKEVAISWTPVAWDEYLYWHKQDFRMVEKINALLDECMHEPFQGTGKPEPLKGTLTGFWSRRIDREHRLVYMVEADVVYVVKCRYHY